MLFSNTLISHSIYEPIFHNLPVSAAFYPAVNCSRDHVIRDILKRFKMFHSFLRLVVTLTRVFFPLAPLLLVLVLTLIRAAIVYVSFHISAYIVCICAVISGYFVFCIVVLSIKI